MHVNRIIYSVPIELCCGEVASFDQVAAFREIVRMTGAFQSVPALLSRRGKGAVGTNRAAMTLTNYCDTTADLRTGSSSRVRRVSVSTEARPYEDANVQE